MMKQATVLAVVLAAALATSGAALQITQLEFEFSLEPGEEREFSFQVRNDDDRPHRISVALGDWERAPNGDHVFKEPGTLERSLSDWLEVQPTSSTLPPGGVEEISGRVRVPSEAELEVGSYWGMIFVQGEPRLTEYEGAMVMAVERFGVKVLVDVPPTEREAKIENLQPQGLNPLWVEVEVANTGNTNLRIGGYLEVYDEAGDVVGTYELAKFPCLPGARRTVRVETDLELEPGTYLVLVRIDPGVDPLVAKQQMVRVRELALQPLEDGWGVPQDLTGDGRYEDVMGDGRFHQGDVDALAEHLYRPAIQRNWRAFDFTNDGEVGQQDVEALQAALDGQTE